MPLHDETVLSLLTRAIRKRCDKLFPPKTLQDELTVYYDDPVGFAHNILGLRTWKRQNEILNAVAEHEAVAVVSGHKTGKSTSFAILALWWFATRPEARVVLMSTTDRQVNHVLWREIKRIAKRAPVRFPSTDNIPLLARTGINDYSDLSEIKGYTAKQSEAAAGVSGVHVLYLIDEANGIDDAIFEAIEGNRAAGATTRKVIAGNPTKSEGELFEAFHSKKKPTNSKGERGYYTVQIDSRETPNCTGDEEPIPGLASKSWVEERLYEWGEDNPIFQIRVAGNFAVAESGKIFKLQSLLEAEERWHEAPAKGRLYIGLDPAGDGPEGDSSVIALRRGAKVMSLESRTGVPKGGHLTWLLERIAHYREPDDELPPVVVLDAEGDVGARVFRELSEHLDSRPNDFELCRVRSSEGAVREPLVYGTIRDELWSNGAKWLQSGGAIPEHPRLQRDLHSAEFTFNIRGRLKATPKKDIRKSLGRSPDFGDAVLLACWEPLSVRQQELGAPKARPAVTVHEEVALNTFDPYDGLNVWNRQ